MKCDKCEMKEFCKYRARVQLFENDVTMMARVRGIFELSNAIEIRVNCKFRKPTNSGLVASQLEPDKGGNHEPVQENKT